MKAFDALSLITPEEIESALFDTLTLCRAEFNIAMEEATGLAIEVARMKPFKMADLQGHGLVLRLDNGSEFHVTITQRTKGS